MKKWQFGLFALSFIFLTLIFFTSVSAESGSWFDESQTPTVALEKSSTSLPKTTYYKAPCAQTTYKYYSISGWGERQYGETTSCAHTTNYGLYSTHGVRLAGTDTSYGFRDKNSSPISLYPVPGGNEAIQFFSAGGLGWSFYVYHAEDVPQNIEPIYDYATNKPNYYKLKNDPVVQKYNDGKWASILPEGLSYGGGRYVASNAGANQVLIDLRTNTARKFGFNTNRPDSTKPNATTTITEDGSKVFVMEPNKLIYRIYNMQDCTPNLITGVEDCAYRDISQTLKQTIPEFRGVASARFSSKDRLEVFVSTAKPEGGFRIDQYSVSVGAVDSFDMQYLALGDSYASGEGVHNYKPLTDVSGNKCHTSLSSYPYLIKTKLEYQTAESIACSGAKIKDLIESINLPYFQNDPQANGKTTSEFDQEIFTGFLPGYRYQNDFVENKNPAAVTVSIGGNDIDFGKKLQYCILVPGDCFSDATSRQKIYLEIKNQFSSLVKTYQAIKANNPKTKVYVIGYPYILKPGGDCANNVRLTANETQLAEDIEADLNKVIQMAAQKAGVHYVDTSMAMEGHRLCEDKSWNLAFNGITAGNDKLVIIGNETYHPNKLGHELYEKVILEKTSNLTTIMPEPDESASVDSIPSKLVPDGVVPETVAKPILSGGVVSDIVQIGTKVIKTISVNDQFFKPGSQFNVEIHSTPQLIGTATATDMQNISVEVQVPQDLEPGAHSLHIIGTNINNQPIDIYKNILVIKDEQDYDGDGILNEQDKCNFVAPVNIDSDKDGIDDSCDGEIAEPPAPPVDPTPPPKPSTHPAPFHPHAKKIAIFVAKIFRAFFSFFRTWF